MASMPVANNNFRKHKAYGSATRKDRLLQYLEADRRIKIKGVLKALFREKEDEKERKIVSKGETVRETDRKRKGEKTRQTLRQKREQRERESKSER